MNTLDSFYVHEAHNLQVLEERKYQAISYENHAGAVIAGFASGQPYWVGEGLYVVEIRAASQDGYGLEDPLYEVVGDINILQTHPLLL